MSTFLESQLSALHNEIRGCEKCGLCATRTRAVPGKFGSNISFMVIGESPGKDEDEQGLPFVGWGGEFFEAECFLAGVNLNRAYTTNVIKCRPVANNYNRPPTKEELASCRPWLENQLSQIRPRVIVPTGKYAIAFILNADPVSIKVREFAGKSVVINDRIVYPLFNPAYAARCKQDDADDYFKFKVHLHRLKLLLAGLDQAEGASTVAEEAELLERLRNTTDAAERKTLQGILSKAAPKAG